MFTEETVFILGAGASVPYGYPTGENLLLRLRSLADEPYSPHDTTAIKNTRHFRDFYNSNFESSINIDSFLRDNVELFDACIRLICSYFLTLETSNIFKAVDNKDWLKFVVEEICNCNTVKDNPENIIKNTVKFITFNYDKSLEKYLYESIKSKPHLSQYADKFINSEDRIIHVYGDLYKFQFETKAPTDFFKNASEYGRGKPIYEAFYDYDEIYNNQPPNIQLIGGIKQSNSAERAKNVLAKAERVIAIGYAFDDANNKMIGLDNIITRDKSNIGYPFLNYTNFDHENRKIDATVRKLASNLVDGLYARTVEKHTCDGFDLLRSRLKLSS